MPHSMLSFAYFNVGHLPDWARGGNKMRLWIPHPVGSLRLYPTLDSAFTCEEPLIGGFITVVKKQTK